MNFKSNVIKKLQGEGFTVSPAKRHCGYELISVNPIGRQAGIRVSNLRDLIRLTEKEDE